MNRKAVLIASGSLAVIVFLLGFIPQYLRSRRLEDQLAADRQTLNSEQEKSQVNDLGLLIGYVYLETNLKNYGLASQYATKFFDRVRTMADQPHDPGPRTFLQSTLAKRDSVIGGLAKGDPSIGGAVQDLFQRTLAATQTGSN